jgi:hypothetical protein
MFRWLESLFEKDELDSDWCFFTDVIPSWATWGFPAGSAAFCIGIVWILWPVL